MKRILNTIIAVSGMILSIVLWVVRPGDKVSVWFLVALIFFFYVILFLILDFKIVYRLPKVISIATSDDSKKKYLIIEKSDLLQQGNFITVYYQASDEETQTIIGRGYIESIHENGRAQVLIDYVLPDEKSRYLFNSLENKKSTIQCIKIKLGLNVVLKN